MERRSRCQSPPTPQESIITTLADRPLTRSDRGGVPSLASGSTFLEWSIAILLLWLLVGPRIDLPPALHGLRVEDLVFAALAVACAMSARGFRRPSSPTVGVLAVVVTGLISAGVATARGLVSPLDSLLFAVRPLEYWIVFPAVLLLLRSADGRWSSRFDQLLTMVTLLQAAFAVLQYYVGLPIGFSHAAYTRAAGLTVGPYELGAMTAVLAIYWVARGRWALASLSFIALAASISRISILGAGVGIALLAVGWLLRMRKRIKVDGVRDALRIRRSPLRLIAQLSSVAIAALVLAFTVGLIRLPVPAPGSTAAQPSSAPTNSLPTATPTASAPAGPPSSLSAGSPALSMPSDSIAQRLATTSILGNWFAAQSVAERVPHPRNSEEYQFEAYAGMNIYLNANTAADAGADESNLVRFFRWHLILDTMNDPAAVLVGLGPSYVGPSVDGSYVRMFADGGVLGLLAWAVLIGAWAHRRPLWMTCAMLSMLIGGLFIDIVYAERPMVLFWALLALSVARDRLARDGYAGDWATRGEGAPAIAHV